MNIEERLNIPYIPEIGYVAEDRLRIPWKENKEGIHAHIAV